MGKLIVPNNSGVVCTGIYKDLNRLKRVINQTRFYMTKIDREAYWSPMMKHANLTLGYFILSYRCTDSDDKFKYSEAMTLVWEVLKSELRDVAEFNVLESHPPKTYAKPTGSPADIEKLKVEITECMIALERGLDKWFVTRITHRHNLSKDNDIIDIE